MSIEQLDNNFAGLGMYREHILDHYKHPHHFGQMKKEDFSHEEHNPVCGDHLLFQLALDKQGKIRDVRFSGSGCAISMASASLLSDEIMGKTMDQIQKMTRENILSLLGIELGPTRLKCAMLSLDTVKNAFLIHEKYGRKQDG